MKRFIFFSGLLLPILAFSQFTGRVVNDNNNGVPFASVSIKGTTIGVVTDSTGRFAIPAEQRYPFTVIVSLSRISTTGADR
jgi:iron complex outermembrane receptor protein